MTYTTKKKRQLQVASKQGVQARIEKAEETKAAQVIIEELRCELDKLQKQNDVLQAQQALGQIQKHAKAHFLSPEEQILLSQSIVNFSEKLFSVSPKDIVTTCLLGFQFRQTNHTLRQRFIGCSIM